MRLLFFVFLSLLPGLIPTPDPNPNLFFSPISTPRDYRDVFKLVESCVCDRPLTPQEKQVGTS